MLNFVPTVAYHFCLALPAAFTKPGDHLLAEPIKSLLAQAPLSAEFYTLFSESISFSHLFSPYFHFFPISTAASYVMPSFHDLDCRRRRREREIYDMAAAAICFPIFSFLQIKDFFSLSVQGLAKRRSPGLVNFVTAVAYHLCLALPAAFT